MFLYFCLSGHVAGRAAQIEWASKVSWTHNLQSFVASCNAYCSGKICFYNSKSSLEIKNPSNEFGTPRPRDRSPIFCAAFTFTSSSSNALPFIRNPDISFPAAASRARASNFRSNTCCCRDRALHHHPLYIILWDDSMPGNGGGAAAGRRIKRTVLASSQRRAPLTIVTLRGADDAAIVQIC